MPGGFDLKTEVLDNSTCALCGACLDWCPYLYNLEDRLIMRFDCSIQDGRCYSVCPRTFTDWVSINDYFLKGSKASEEIGFYKEFYKARSNTRIPGQQDGGTVSQLLKTALKEKLADAVLLTGVDAEFNPYPFMGKELEDIKRAVGSRFLASPGLRILTQVQNEGIESLIVVARPCQVQALRKMQYHRYNDQKIPELTIVGLFCMWSLDWKFKNYLEENYGRVKGITIPQHGMKIETADGVRKIPTEVVKNFIRTGCGYCFDLTAEMADISVGAFEAEAGWNTLIIRTDRGRALFNEANKNNVMAVEKYPEEEWKRLKNASYQKKRRGLQKIAELQTDKQFIDLSKEIYNSILEDDEGMVKS